MLAVVCRARALAYVLESILDAARGGERRAEPARVVSRCVGFHAMKTYDQAFVLLEHPLTTDCHLDLQYT